MQCALEGVKAYAALHPECLDNKEWLTLASSTRRALRTRDKERSVSLCWPDVDNCCNKVVKNGVV